MRAFMQEGYGSPDVLKLRDIPTPAVTDDTVLVKVRAASVNAVDYHLIHMSPAGRLFFGLRRPKTPIRGFDVAGVVDAVGKNVARFKPGDEVLGCGKGTFAEYVGTTEDRLVLKPAGISFAQAAAIPVAALSSLQGLRDHGELRRGQRVLIHGAGGGVGTFAVQIAKALGAHVTAVTSTRNFDVIRALGPDVTLDYTREDFAARGETYDLVFDVAATRSLRDCLSVLTPKGIFVRAGAPKDGVMSILTGLVAMVVVGRFTSQRVKWYIGRVRREDLDTLLELVTSGKVTPAIDRDFPFAQTPDAIRYAKSGQGRAKVVISMD